MCAASTITSGLHYGNFQKCDYVIVQGCGALGMYACAFTKQLGAKKVIAIDFNDNRLELAKQFGVILIFAIVTFGALLPLLRRVIVPASMSPGAGPMLADADDEDLEKVEVQEGDTLEDIKAKLKPKKAAISAEMLDTANTYDDKVAVIRMIVGDQAGRVSNVFKNMMQEQPVDE